MNLQERIHLLVRLGNYITSNDLKWQAVQQRAEQENPWFTQVFIQRALHNIAHAFLQEEQLKKFVETYRLPPTTAPKAIGLVMAGNIPLVGFHDWLCIFLSGHIACIKLSEKDKILFPHLLAVMSSWNAEVQHQTKIAALLKGCDAYIATGSNNTARYFNYYFGKYKHIIRKNRTSVAVLDGTETSDELALLANDIHYYFGLGCRNVTKLYVPLNYDFIPFLDACKKFSYFLDHNKYKNNYDYQLALHLLNNNYYMSSGALLVVQEEVVFSAISQLHYSVLPAEKMAYELLLNHIKKDDNIQCIVGHEFTAFGMAQQPSLTDFADGVDTMIFLNGG
jgi:hypothetical protein